MEIFKFTQTITFPENAASSFNIPQISKRTEPSTAFRLTDKLQHPNITPTACAEEPVNAAAASADTQTHLHSDFKWNCVDAKDKLVVFGGSFGFLAVYCHLYAAQLLSLCKLLQLPSCSNITKVNLLSSPLSVVAGTQNGELYIVEIQELLPRPEGQLGSFLAESHFIRASDTKSPITAMASMCHVSTVDSTVFVMYGDGAGAVNCANIAVYSSDISQTIEYKLKENNAFLNEEAGEIFALQICTASDGELNQNEIDPNEQPLLIVSGSKRNAILHLCSPSSGVLAVYSCHFIGSKEHRGVYTATACCVAGDHGQKEVRLSSARPGGRLWVFDEYGVVERTLKLSQEGVENRPQLNRLSTIMDNYVLSWAGNGSFGGYESQSQDSSKVILCNVRTVSCETLMTVEGSIIEVAMNHLRNQLIVLHGFPSEKSSSSRSNTEASAVNDQPIRAKQGEYHVDFVVIRKTKTELVSSLMRAIASVDRKILSVEDDHTNQSREELRHWMYTIIEGVLIHLLHPSFFEEWGLSAVYLFLQTVPKGELGLYSTDGNLTMHNQTPPVGVGPLQSLLLFLYPLGELLAYSQKITHFKEELQSMRAHLDTVIYLLCFCERIVLNTHYEDSMQPFKYFPAVGVENMKCYSMKKTNTQTHLKVPAIPSTTAGTHSHWPSSTSLQCIVHDILLRKHSTFHPFNTYSSHPIQLFQCSNDLHVLCGLLHLILNYPADAWKHPDVFKYSLPSVDLQSAAPEQHATTNFSNVAHMLEVEHYLGHLSPLQAAKWFKPIRNWEAHPPNEAVEKHNNEGVITVHYLVEGSGESGGCAFLKGINMLHTRQLVTLGSAVNENEDTIDKSTHLFQMARRAANHWKCQSDKFAAAASDVALHAVAATAMFYEADDETKMRLCEMQAPADGDHHCSIAPSGEEDTHTMHKVDVIRRETEMKISLLDRGTTSDEDKLEIEREEAFVSASSGAEERIVSSNAIAEDGMQCSRHEEYVERFSSYDTGDKGVLLDRTFDHDGMPISNEVCIVDKYGKWKKYYERRMEMGLVGNGWLPGTPNVRSQSSSGVIKEKDGMEENLWRVVYCTASKLFTDLCAVNRIFMDKMIERGEEMWIMKESEWPLLYASETIGDNEAMEDGVHVHRGNALLRILWKIATAISALFNDDFSAEITSQPEDVDYLEEAKLRVAAEQLRNALGLQRIDELKYDTLNSFLKNFRNLWNQKNALLYCKYFFCVPVKYWNTDIEEAVCHVFAVCNGLGWRNVCEFLVELWKDSRPEKTEFSESPNILEIHYSLRSMIASLDDIHSSKLNGEWGYTVPSSGIMESDLDKEADQAEEMLNEDIEDKSIGDTTTKKQNEPPAAKEMQLLQKAIEAFPLVLPSNMFQWMMDTEAAAYQLPFRTTEKVPAAYNYLLHSGFSVTAKFITASKLQLLNHYLLHLVSRCSYSQNFANLLLTSAQLSILLERHSHLRTVFPNFASTTLRPYIHLNSHLWHTSVPPSIVEQLIYPIPAALNIPHYRINTIKHLLPPQLPLFPYSPDLESLYQSLWYSDELLDFELEVKKYRKEAYNFPLPKLLKNATPAEITLCIYNIYPRVLFYMLCGYSFGLYKLLDQLLLILYDCPLLSLQQIYSKLSNLVHTQNTMVENEESISFSPAIVKWINKFKLSPLLDIRLLLQVCCNCMIAALSQTSLQSAFPYPLLLDEQPPIYPSTSLYSDSEQVGASTVQTEESDVENTAHMAPNCTSVATDGWDEFISKPLDPLPGWCYDVLNCLERLSCVIARVESCQGLSDPTLEAEEKDTMEVASKRETFYLWEIVHCLLLGGRSPQKYITEHDWSSLSPCRGLTIQMGLQLSKRIRLKHQDMLLPSHLNEIIQEAVAICENPLNLVSPAEGSEQWEAHGGNSEGGMGSPHLISNYKEVLDTIDFMKNLFNDLE